MPYLKASSSKISFFLLIKRLSQGIFVGVFLFEIAHYVGVVRAPVVYTWLGLAITSFVSFIALFLIDIALKRKHIGQLDWHTWALCLILLLIDLAGDIRGLYDVWWYDQFAHFMGGIILGSVLLSFFTKLQQARGWIYPPTLHFLLVLGLNSILAFLYETEEYLEDIFFHSNRLGDGPDTVNDLLLNWMGCVIVLASIRAYQKYFSRDARTSIKPFLP